MKKIKICLSFLSLVGLMSCAEEVNGELPTEKKTEKKIKGKWFYDREEEIDENGNVESFLDLSGKECNSGFIIFKDNNITEEEHADKHNDCEKFEYDGTWHYNEQNKVLTFVDTEDDYIVKGILLKVDDKELRIKLTQQGDDVDFEDWNTHMVFKKTL